MGDSRRNSNATHGAAWGSRAEAAGARHLRIVPLAARGRSTLGAKIAVFGPVDSGGYRGGFSGFRLLPRAASSEVIHMAVLSPTH
jgi:hypothetical protein